MNRKGSAGAVFYKAPGAVTEIRSGYLIKSPPLKRLTSEKSWKKRYFVLFKISEQEHHLKYFRSPEEKERGALGGIDLSEISLLNVNPESHQKWAWIQRNFRCSASCVLYIRAAERDYFLVGECSEEVDSWFSDIFNALESRPHRFISSEEITNGEKTTEISYPFIRKKSSAAPPVKPQLKTRSVSEPAPPLNDSAKKDEDYLKRPVSEPVNPIYDYPRSFLRKAQFGENNGTDRSSGDSVYESMREIKLNEQLAQAEGNELEDGTTGSLMRSVYQVIDKFKSQISPLTSFNEEPAAEDSEETHLSDSSSSSENSVDILDTQSTTESLDPVTQEEKDIVVKQADLKKHLTLTDVDGKPSVTGWTGQPKTQFIKGDQILAINDLHTGSVEEFNTYLSKSLKNEMRVTILPACTRLHSTSCSCSD